MCLLDVFEKVRNKQEYDAFRKAIDSGRPAPKANRYDAETTEEELREWLKKEQQAEAKSQKPESICMPEDVAVWLRAGSYTPDDAAFTVYETAGWVNAFLENQGVRRYWQTYLELVEAALSKCANYKFEYPVKTEDLVMAETRSERVILFAPLPPNALLLMAACERPAADAEAAKCRLELERFFGAKMTEPLTADRLRPFADRCYPDYMVADPDVWFNIECHEEGNLALSPEQQGFLLGAFGSGGMPVFINGRAGSGKSTMLLYAMAELVYLRETKNEPRSGDVLYMTCNERLLDRARDSLMAILKTNTKYAQGHRISAARASEIAQRQMHPFRKYLLRLLDPESVELFQPEKLVGFSEFRQFYEKWSGRPKEMSTEICWHVIRVHIEGSEAGQPNSSIKPDDYEEIPRRERTISEEDYELVAKTVWPWYEELCRKNGYWDDQMLVRHLLTRRLEPGQIAALLLDEAQDLTRLELQMVLRLTQYTRYDLSRVPYVDTLPFVIAGDPFQTLNPTGFRASGLCSIFFNEVSSCLDPDRRWDIKLRVSEMSKNYRSAKAVVHLSNLVQLTRRALFRHEDVRPQECWFPLQSAQPLKFILGKNIQAEDMQKNLVGTIIIVPCEEGAEEDYVKRHMQAIFPRVASCPKNVLSAAASKGLEFNKVVLYNFGEHIEQVIPPLEKFLDTYDDVSDSQKMQAEYFFNKLYVGSSRSIRHLLIVDTEKGDHFLWEELTRLRSRCLGTVVRTNEPSEEEAELEWDTLSAERIQNGLAEDFSALREENPAAVAVEFEKKGIALGNSDYLRRAASYYEDIGHKKDATRCLALSFEYEHKYTQAGDLFARSNDKIAAERCYWAGQAWVQYLGTATDLQQPRARLARFMVREDAGERKEFIEFLRATPSAAKENEAHWRASIRKLANEVITEPPDTRSVQEWCDLAALLRNFGYLDKTNIVPAEAKLWLRGEAYAQATEAWEKAKLPNVLSEPGYLEAKARCLDFPANVEWLEKNGDHSTIIGEWNRVKNHAELKKVEWGKYVAPAYERAQCWAEALAAYQMIPGTPIKKYRAILSECSQSLTSDRVLAGALGLIECLADEKRYYDGAEIVSALGKERMLAKQGDRLRVAARLLARLGRSTSYFGAEPKERRQLLSDTAGLLRDKQEEYLPWAEMGAALEHIGYEVEALQFYERKRNDSDVGYYAKLRWLACMQRRLEMQDDSRIEREQADRRKEWGIPDDQEIAKFPTAEELNLGGKITKQETEDVKGVISFAHLKIEIKPDKNLLLITDTVDLYTARVDLMKRTVKGEKVCSVSEGGDESRFTLASDDEARSVQCTIVFSSPRSIELRLGIMRSVINI